MPKVFEKQNNNVKPFCFCCWEKKKLSICPCQALFFFGQQKKLKKKSEKRDFCQNSCCLAILSACLSCFFLRKVFFNICFDCLKKEFPKPDSKILSRANSESFPCFFCQLLVTLFCSDACSSTSNQTKIVRNKFDWVVFVFSNVIFQNVKQTGQKTTDDSFKRMNFKLLSDYNSEHH